MANTFRNYLPKGSQAIKDLALRVLCHESFQIGELAAPSRVSEVMFPKRRLGFLPEKVFSTHGRHRFRYFTLGSDEEEIGPGPHKRELI